MIHYDLVCGGGHEFDSWFRDSAAYDAQTKRGLVTCPQCGSPKVSKQLMRPGIPLKDNRKAEPKPPALADAPAAEAPTRMFAGSPDPRQQILMNMIRDLRKHVEENADYVGDKFPEE